MQVQSLAWKDCLEKEMATHFRMLAWEISWTEEVSGLQSMGSQESDTTTQLNNNNLTAEVSPNGVAPLAHRADSPSFV